jgi:DNA-binding transcriptional ArsR family regulator
MTDTATYSVENLSRILKALSDVNRLKIVMYIDGETRSVSEIIKDTGLSQTLVSFHLRALREAHIVTTEREGPFILYSLSDPNLGRSLIKLAKSAGPNGNRTKKSPEAESSGVLNKRR